MNDTAVLGRKPPYLPLDRRGVLRCRSALNAASRTPLQPIRIPVTPANRARLRELRERELAHWNSSSAKATRTDAIPQQTGTDRDAFVLLLLLGIAVLGLMLRTSPFVFLYPTP